MKMVEIKNEAVRRALKNLAEREGITEEEVVKQIHLSMLVAMNHPDPAVRALWAMLPAEDGIPTIDGLVEFLIWGMEAAEDEEE